MIVYRLMHYYSRMEEKFFGIQCNLSLIELNLTIAYLQCIRERLPVLAVVEDTLSEMSCMVLLHELFVLRKITTFQPYESAVDLHRNWIDYSLYSNEFQEYLNDIAVNNASLAVLKLMAKEAMETIVTLKRIGSDEYPYAARELETLMAAVSGAEVLPEWEWYDINHTPLDGRVFLPESVPELIPLRGNGVGFFNYAK